MAQWIKTHAMQTWQTKFNLWNIPKVEEEN